MIINISKINQLVKLYSIKLDSVLSKISRLNEKKNSILAELKTVRSVISDLSTESSEYRKRTYRVTLVDAVMSINDLERINRQFIKQNMNIKNKKEHEQAMLSEIINLDQQISDLRNEQKTLVVKIEKYNELKKLIAKT